MGKPTLVRRPDDPQARSPEREALAAAIASHEALKAAVAENLVSQRRAEDAKFTAIRAHDAANKGVEIAKAADAESIAAGTRLRRRSGRVSVSGRSAVVSVLASVCMTRRIPRLHAKV
jgi:hypothetical protein